MAVLRTSLLTLMLVYTTCGSPTPVSARDQYEAREDWSQPPQLFNEATDQSFKTHKVHRFGLPLKKSAPQEKNDIVPDLQVGCGDGFIVEPTADGDKKSKLAGLEKLKQRRRRSLSDPERKRRNYYPATHIIRTPASISYSYSSAWRPQPYQIARPYYIPLWGSGGKSPVHFPPQPILLNPGFPLDNPLAHRRYLPPATVTTPKPGSATIGSRFGEPIWGEAAPTTTTTTGRPRPSRRTRRPGQTTTHPPLVHSYGDEDGVDDIFINEVEPLPPTDIKGEIEKLFPRPPTTAAPPPPPVLLQASRPIGGRVPQRPSGDRQSMNCVFAIVSCCSASSNDVDLACFEARGCPGPFWGANPCDSKFSNAALQSADKYYNP